VGYHDRCLRQDFYDTQMKSPNKIAALLFFLIQGSKTVESGETATY
jgi:hypothetical protein